MDWLGYRGWWVWFITFKHSTNCDLCLFNYDEFNHPCIRWKNCIRYLLKKLSRTACLECREIFMEFKRDMFERSE